MAFWDDEDELAEDQTGMSAEDDQVGSADLNAAPNRYADDFGERISDDNEVAGVTSDDAAMDDDTISSKGALYEQMPVDDSLGADTTMTDTDTLTNDASTRAARGDSLDDPLDDDTL